MTVMTGIHKREWEIEFRRALHIHVFKDPVCTHDALNVSVHCLPNYENYGLIASAKLITIKTRNPLKNLAAYFINWTFRREV